MKILFLGTGAADYTGNEKELRRNSSALIDDIILIDPNSYVLDAIKEFNVDISFMFKLPVEKEVQMFLSEVEEKLRLAKYHKLMDEQSEKIGKLCGVTAEMICRERGML
jgi:hypothetical protein